jgi:hypothetical protein
VDVQKLLADAGFSKINSVLNDEPEMEIQGNKVKLQGLCIYGFK